MISVGKKIFIVGALLTVIPSLIGCMNDQATGSKDDVRSDVPNPEDSKIRDIGPGQPLVGAELDAVMAQMSPAARKEIEAAAAKAALKPLGKTAVWPTCLVDFNSSVGLSYMADKAYNLYATSPYYYQPCSPYIALVQPSSGYNNYYLVPEQSNVCTGSYGMMGTGPDFAHCTNQKSAALFPRYAASATITTGGLGIQVTLAYNAAFRLNSFVGKSGTIKVVAYRVGIGWWYWGPLPSNNTYWTFSNADNVTSATFYAWDGVNTYAIDNVSVNAL